MRASAVKFRFQESYRAGFHYQISYVFPRTRLVTFQCLRSAHGKLFNIQALALAIKKALFWPCRAKVRPSPYVYLCMLDIQQRTKAIGRGPPGLEQKSSSRKLLRITIHASHLLYGTKEAFFLFLSCLRKGARYSSAENVFSDELLPGLLVECRNEEEVSR